jgi:hypothetical protein
MKYFGEAAVRLWQSASKVKHVAMESIRGSPALRRIDAHNVRSWWTGSIRVSVLLH